MKDAYAEAVKEVHLCAVFRFDGLIKRAQHRARLVINLFPAYQ